MRRGLKLILTIMFTVLFFVPCITAMGAEGSRNIRIGLNYGYDSVSSVSAAAENGIDIGYSDAEGTFRLLCEQPDNKVVNIRKDGNFVKTAAGELIEYSPTEVPYAGEVIGPGISKSVIMWKILIWHTALRQLLIIQDWMVM